MHSEPREAPALDPWWGWGTRKWEWDTCLLIQGRGTAGLQPGSQHRAWHGACGRAGAWVHCAQTGLPRPLVGSMAALCKAWEGAGGSYPGGKACGEALAGGGVTLRAAWIKEPGGLTS